MKQLSLLLFVLLLSDGCSRPAKKNDALSESGQIDAYIQQYINIHKIPGLSIAATRNDSVVFIRSYGVREIGKTESLTQESVFHWASVSKTFVATSIMQLVEQRKINLDEKLITYLPYFRLKDPRYKDITIRQILNHTSGIGDVEDYEWDKPQNDDAAPERYVRGLTNDGMKFVPGTDWAYSNTAFEILGVVISKISGMSFESYVRKNILEPLSMEHTSFIYPEIPEELRTSGHRWSAGVQPTHVYPYNKIHAPSSTLNSNVRDMTHYAMANLHRGDYQGKRILPDSAYTTLWTNSVNLKDKPAIGASWFLDDHDGVKTVRHGGGDTGFRSFLLLVPEKNISVMVASNYELTRTGDLSLAVLDLLTGKHPAEIRRQIGFSFAEISSVSGPEKAKEFYFKALADSALHRHYQWKEDQGALSDPAFELLDQKRVKEAIELLKLDLDLHPDSGYALGNLGVAYSRNGDTALAKQHLSKAVSLLPKSKYYQEEYAKIK